MNKWPRLSGLLFALLAHATCQAEECDARAIPDALNQQLVQKDYSGAEAAAQALVAAQPDKREAHLTLAKVYINAALRPALQFDFKALGIDPGKTGEAQPVDIKALMNATSDDYYVDADFSAKAARQIDLTVKRWPDTRSLLYCLTKMDFYARDHARFLATLQRTAQAFAEAETEAVGFFLGYAQTYMRQNRPNHAADVYSTLLKTFPKNAALLSSLGVTELQQGRMRRAVELFDRAHQHAPDDVIVIGNVFEAAILTGDFAKAEKFGRRKAELRPDDTSTYFDLAMIAMHKGAANSLPYWDTYFQQHAKHPDDPRWANHAQTIQRLASEGLEDEEHFELAYQMIESLRTPKYAIPLLAYLRAKDPGEPAYRYRMGHAYDRGNHYELAEEALLDTLKLLERRPAAHIELSADDVRYHLARMAYSLEKYKDSLTHLDQIDPSGPQRVEGGYLYGLNYRKLNRMAEARAAFEACVTSASEQLRELCRQQLASF